MIYRGVVLAGGKGTRLGELTRVVNKHLLPVGDEPMVYHPLRKLVGAGVRDILLVSGPESLGDFIRQLGSGKALGCSLTYRAQDEPGGIAQALGLAESYCGDRPCAVLLGDNVFHDALGPLLQRTIQNSDHAWIALKQVHDPSRYGIAELQGHRIVALEEKPREPRSDLAIAGIYVFPPEVFALIRQAKPSARGEWEITDINRAFLEQGRLQHVFLEGYWTDAGTPESLDLAKQLVKSTPPLF